MGWRTNKPVIIKNKKLKKEKFSELLCEKYTYGQCLFADSSHCEFRFDIDNNVSLGENNKTYSLIIPVKSSLELYSALIFDSGVSIDKIKNDIIYNYDLRIL